MSCSGLIPEGRLLAAFSGGEDSLYMLMLLAREAGERTEAAYVDHGIRSRAELGREIALNRENAARLGIRLHIITLAPGAVAALAREKGIGVEAAARTLRYGALEKLRKEIGADWILTAHHREDQAETVIMRLMASAPIWALGGIRRQEGHIFRPLLSVPKAEISAAVRASGLRFSVDSTNADDSYLRNGIRKRIMPRLPEEAISRLAGLAARCQELARHGDIPMERGFFVTIARKAFAEASMPAREDAIFRAFAGMGYAGRLSRRLVASICSKESGSLEAGGISVYFARDGIRIYPELPSFVIPFSDGAAAGPLRFTSEHACSRTLRIDMDLVAGPLIARKSREGDRISLKGGSRNVKALEKDWRIPYSVVLEDRIGLVAVLARAFGGNDRLSERFLGHDGVPVSLIASV